MYLYVGSRKVWVTRITKYYSVGEFRHFTLGCKEHACCSVPFDIYVELNSIVTTCDEYGFTTGKKYTGDALFPLMESLNNELALEKL
jgi:hypothetical protein